MSKTIRELIDEGILSLDTVVLGTPPMTADGCVVIDKEIYHPVFGRMYLWADGNGAWRAKPWLSDYKNAVLVSECYSTPNAAEAAKEGAQ